MPRVFLIVLDSVGIGGAPDAAQFGDEGANTVLHIAEACAAGHADQDRQGPLHLPNLDRLGLGAATQLASGTRPPGLAARPQGRWGAATEVSQGKDTPSGHWELAGLPVPWDWTFFPNTDPAFPDDIVAETCRLAGTDGILGNCHASGTEIVARLGQDHQTTGWPICYTSTDSVFQIAAHEDSFGLDRLLTLCESLAPMLHARKIGRVIARPFTGTPGTYQRTKNRRDYAIAPPRPTLCNWVQDAGGRVHAVGKIGDIFSMQGIDDKVTGTDADLMTHLIRLAAEAEPNSLTFANFVEFDSKYGHRRDVAGYARHLEWFDAQIPAVLANLGPDDIAIFTADHGNDPTWPGTDHTRERVPVLIHGAGAAPLGQIAFADVAALAAAHLGIKVP